MAAILYVAAGVFGFAIAAAVILELLARAAGGPEELDEPDVELRTRPHGNVDPL